MKCLRGPHESTLWHHEDKLLQIFVKIFVKISSLFLSLITKSQPEHGAGDGFLRDTRYLLCDHHEVRLEFTGGLASRSGLCVGGKIYSTTIHLLEGLQMILMMIHQEKPFICRRPFR